MTKGCYLYDALSSWGFVLAAVREKIGHRALRALKPDSEVWCSSLPGFGARRQRSEAITFQVIFRTHEGRQRRMKLGRYGVLTPDEARALARQVLVDVIAGKDPAVERRQAKNTATVADLVNAYWAAMTNGQVMTRKRIAKKASTMVSDKGRLYGHVVPLLGKLPVASVTHIDIERFMHAVTEGDSAKRQKTGTRGVSVIRGGAGVASRTVGLLGGVFEWGIRQGFTTNNPCRGIVRQADGVRERRLSDAEYALLGRALRQAEADKVIWPAAIGAVKFLTLTGWRRSEALHLKWADVDLVRRTAVLPDSKSGKSIRALSLAACEVLRSAGRGLDSAVVFLPSRGAALDPKKPWAAIAKLAGLPSDITLHTLRHSFVSVAGDLQFADGTVGALVGHAQNSVTSRYNHAADRVLLDAADRIAAEITQRMACHPSVQG